MTDVIKRMIDTLSPSRVELTDPEGYKDGRITGDKEQICVDLLLASQGLIEPVPSLEYYVGKWDIRYPDGTPLWEHIPEAKGMYDAGVLDGMV